MSTARIVYLVSGVLGAVTAPIVFSAQVLAAKCQEVYVLAYPGWYNGLTCNGSQPALTNLNDTWVIVMNIIQWIIITAGYAAVVFIIVGGFMYMTAQGEPSKIAEAKKSITNAIIGLVVALAAVMIVRTVQGAISGSIV